jgi:hypothetical protein
MIDTASSAPGEWLRRLVSESGGAVRFQLSAEVLVDFPVEVFIQGNPGFVTAEMLGVSPRLERDLVAWLRWWQGHVGLDGGDDDQGPEHPEGWRIWAQQRELLTVRLCQELGPGVEAQRG